jgi:isoleucyl-tRNA synthetase
MTERIAFWVDLEHPYITMENSYIESCWWAIKQMWDKGLVYEGYRVTPHCPRCGTSLSSHEVALGYKDNTEDPSVYIKFKVEPASLNKISDKLMDKTAYFMAWTTTPWTLPGNTALAVDAEADYTILEVDEDYIILADALRERMGLDDNKVLEKVNGSRLVGLHYEPLYKVDIFRSTEEKPAYRVISGDFVSMEDGTGIVHIAPAYGEIDYEIGQREGFPLIHTVELNGMVTTNLISGITPKMNEYIQKSNVPVQLGEARRKIDLPGAGKFVKEADEDIIADLDSRGLLFRSEKIYHTYPFCWRCDSPLLYYAKKTWYIKTTAVKERLIAGNEEINWYPEHIKHGRFGDWLQNNVDWAISRERYWGTPLPVWQCQSCANYECIGGLEELKKKPGFSGLKEPLDLHRPYVDELVFDCPKCKGKMKRIAEVIDCWFDSGAMPIAQWHYPFENETLLDDGRFPADYICEAVDQTRGWFYSLHAISTLLFDRPSYKNVICLGHILDARGDKMSKAKGNVVEPGPMLDKYGADALRWYFLTAAPPGNARRFSEKLISEVTRQFLLTLWNVYSFFVTYANIDEFNPASETGKIEPSVMDHWIISELNQVIADVDTALENYNPTEAGRKIESFVSDLSKWYVRRSRRRFWKSENDSDKLAAYTTLYQCLVTLSKLLAPFTPFMAEELYRNLVCPAFPEAADSVHLADFPVADRGKIDKRLSADTKLAIKLSSLGRAARSKAGIKVRQPLAMAVVSLTTKSEHQSMERVKAQIIDELNIKNLKAVDNESELESAGYEVSLEAGYGVAIATEITPELAAEGLARDIVHRLQTMRRSAGFDIADHITTYYQGGEHIKQAMDAFGEYIRRETLSWELVDGMPVDEAFSEKFKLIGNEVMLAVTKVDYNL